MCNLNMKGCNYKCARWFENVLYEKERDKIPQQRCKDLLPGILIT